MEDNNELSQYNEMGLHIARLNDLWTKCYTLRTSGKLLDWKWILNSIESELKFDAKKIDTNRKDTAYVTSISKVKKMILLAEQNNLFKMLYDKLHEFEELLREVQQESGKGTSYAPKDEYSMDD